MLSTRIKKGTVFEQDPKNEKPYRALGTEHLRQNKEDHTKDLRLSQARCDERIARN